MICPNCHRRFAREDFAWIECPHCHWAAVTPESYLQKIWNQEEFHKAWVKRAAVSEGESR